jgi:hypothetical protein
MCQMVLKAIVAVLFHGLVGILVIQEVGEMGANNFGKVFARRFNPDCWSTAGVL